MSKTFIFPFRQNQFKQEIVFGNASIRWLAVAMRANIAVAGSLKEKFFNYR